MAFELLSKLGIGNSPLLKTVACDILIVREIGSRLFPSHEIEDIYKVLEIVCDYFDLENPCNQEAFTESILVSIARIREIIPNVTWSDFHTIFYRCLMVLLGDTRDFKKAFASWRERLAPLLEHPKWATAKKGEEGEEESKWEKEEKEAKEEEEKEMENMKRALDSFVHNLTQIMDDKKENGFLSSLVSGIHAGLMNMGHGPPANAEARERDEREEMDIEREEQDQEQEQNQNQKKEGEDSSSSASSDLPIPLGCRLVGIDPCALEEINMKERLNRNDATQEQDRDERISEDPCANPISWKDEMKTFIHKELQEDRETFHIPLQTLVGNVGFHLCRKIHTGSAALFENMEKNHPGWNMETVLAEESELGKEARSVARHIMNHVWEQDKMQSFGSPLLESLMPTVMGMMFMGMDMGQNMPFPAPAPAPAP
uniref:Uncharacterized protein n=1 Tax=Palpitomonas bilix TaxID=652834 RepID=A0A7S3DJG5_9EUKA|mmetsp:Transcript_40699/g.105639  ORF Transcript_40699/g.105639 Transcript_40699/m.105639 type:complete len:429 (+) Transcript_40699:3528-4814(+)|eukprot:CAMPEP_0113891314 /NCGR_PEP_ID=MMETSP0780_2-20120614/14686_1 /TAXON_ID=652834 /ORGANISM="Palpitomonas bilix" /LENGTH=428 /DNA_ID=CAMNT_0000880915 /DNA_START=350 /DNA_END=1636 /DNA_ORIENTATION=- /assembly_acc=CAM_ASM_000599